MPPRASRFRIEDMLEAVARIERYTAGMTFEQFCSDQKTIDAVIRNFEIMGEAARHVEDQVTQRSPHVPWLDVQDMRNILIHGYFGIDLETVWKTIQDDLAPLKQHLQTLLDDWKRSD